MNNFRENSKKKTKLAQLVLIFLIIPPIYIVYCCRSQPPLIYFDKSQNVKE